MAAAPACKAMLLEQRWSGHSAPFPSQAFAAMADHYLGHSMLQAQLPIAPLRAAPPAPTSLPEPLRQQQQTQAEALQATQPAQQPASQPVSSPELDGPMPGLSVFASAAAAVPAAEAQPAAPQEPQLPEHDRLSGLAELPELPSTLFSASGNLRPLISAFAAAAGETAFDAPSSTAPVAAGVAHSAPAALTAHNLEHRLPSIPQRHTCPCQTQVSLNPIIWRNFEPPFRIMVHVGLKTALEEGEVSLPLGIYSSLNPRVITTGVLPTCSPGMAPERMPASGDACLAGTCSSHMLHPSLHPCVLMPACLQACQTGESARTSAGQPRWAS